MYNFVTLCSTFQYFAILCFCLFYVLWHCWGNLKQYQTLGAKSWKRHLMNHLITNMVLRDASASKNHHHFQGSRLPWASPLLTTPPLRRHLTVLQGELWIKNSLMLPTGLCYNTRGVKKKHMLPRDGWVCYKESYKGVNKR